MTQSRIDSRASVSCPLQQCRQSVLIENIDMRMKYTICIVTPLDHGDDHGPNKYSLFYRHADGTDMPVSFARRQFSALGEIPTAKGPENTRATDEERGGRRATKNECDFAL